MAAKRLTPPRPKCHLAASRSSQACGERPLTCCSASRLFALSLLFPMIESNVTSNEHGPACSGWVGPCPRWRQGSLLLTSTTPTLNNSLSHQAYQELDDDHLVFSRTRAATTPPERHSSVAPAGRPCRQHQQRQGVDKSRNWLFFYFLRELSGQLSAGECVSYVSFAAAQIWTRCVLRTSFLCCFRRQEEGEICQH